MTDLGRPAAESLLELLEERQHLLEIGLWIFDSDVAADRIVQEAYRRWYTLDEDARAAVGVPRAWLTKAIGAICLELLSSAATITALEFPPAQPRLMWSPAAGQLPSSTTAGIGRYTRVVHRFAGACDDLNALEDLLAADAIVVSDGGGKVRTPVVPVHGATEAAHFVSALLCGQRNLAIEAVNGRPGLVLRREGQALAVISVTVDRDRVAAVWITLNPDKLRNWHRF